MKTLFEDRKDAGERLARRLDRFIDERDVIVLALPQGGVPVGHEIARTLRLPLDVFHVRKLCVPRKEEIVMGAVASGGIRVMNSQVIDAMAISPSEVEEVAQRGAEMIQQREMLYRQEAPALRIVGNTVIIVGDGITTGFTIKAAVKALRQAAPKSIVVAVPVAPLSTVWKLRNEVDEFLTIFAPARCFALREWYRDFPQITDDEVFHLLRDAAEPLAMT